MELAFSQFNFSPKAKSHSTLRLAPSSPSKVQLNIVTPTNTGYVPSTQVDLSQALLEIPEDGDILPTYLVDSVSLEYWLSPKVMAPNGQLFNYTCSIVDSDIPPVSTQVFVTFARVNMEGVQCISEFSNSMYPFSLDVLNRIDGQTKVLIKTINFIPGSRYILGGYDLPVLSENEIEESVICMVPPVLASLNLAKSILGAVTPEYYSEGPVDVTFDFGITVEGLFRFLASSLEGNEEAVISKLVELNFKSYSNLAAIVDFNELLLILHTDPTDLVQIVQDVIDIAVLHFSFDLNTQEPETQMTLFLYLCALGMTDVAFHLIDNYEDVMIDDISITGYNAMDFAHHGIGPTTTAFTTSDLEDCVSVRTGEDTNPYSLQSLSDLSTGGWDQAPTSIPMSSTVLSELDGAQKESTTSPRTTKRPVKTVVDPAREERMLTLRRECMFNVHLATESELYKQATTTGISVSAVSHIGTRVEPTKQEAPSSPDKNAWRLSAMVTAKSVTIPPDFLAKPTPPTGTHTPEEKKYPIRGPPASPSNRPVSKLRPAPISAAQGEEDSSDTDKESQEQLSPRGPLTIGDIVTWDRDKVLDWVENTLNIAHEFAIILHNQWIDGRVLIKMDEEKLRTAGLPFGIAFLVNSALEALKNTPEITPRGASARSARPVAIPGPAIAKPSKQVDPENQKRLVNALESLLDEPTEAKPPVEEAPKPEEPAPVVDNKLRGKRFLWSANKKKPEKPKQTPKKPDKTLKPAKKTNSDLNKPPTVVKTHVKSDSESSLSSPPSKKGLTRDGSKNALPEKDTPLSPRKKTESKKLEKTKDKDKAKQKTEKKPKKPEKPAAPADPRQANWLAPDPSWGRAGLMATPVPESLIEKMALSANEASSEKTPSSEKSPEQKTPEHSEEKKKAQASSSSNSGSDSDEPEARPAPAPNPGGIKNTTLANLLKQQKERQEKERLANATKEVAPKDQKTTDAGSMSSPKVTIADALTVLKNFDTPEDPVQQGTNAESRSGSISKSKHHKRGHSQNQTTLNEILGDIASPPGDTVAPPASPWAPFFSKKLTKDHVTQLIEANNDLFARHKIQESEHKENKEKIIQCYMSGQLLTSLKGF